MSRLSAIVVSLLAVALLAGCSSPPPKGTLADQNHSPGDRLAGDAKIHYQAFTGANPASQLPPPVGGTLQCVQPGPAGPVVAPCQPAYTDVKVNATLPRAGSGTWKAYLVNASGEMEVGALTEGAAQGSVATYTASHNYTNVDLSGRFTRVELRLDGFVFSSSDVKEGANLFAVAGSATGVKVQGGSYEGPTLTGTVSGLPANATYEGKLYLPGPDGKAEAEPTASFPLAGNGPFTYTADRDISQFAEFHIHVAGSKVNLYKATITPAAE